MGFFALVLISAFLLVFRDVFTHRACRYCRKSISRNAVICPYCRSDFRPADDPLPAWEEEEEDDEAPVRKAPPVRKVPAFSDEYAAALRKAHKRKGA